MSFKYKTKLLRHIFPYGSNGIVRNATIIVLSKYLSQFWRSLEMQLINYKVELKPKWTKHCMLSVVTNDNIDANSYNIILLSKT